MSSSIILLSYGLFVILSPLGFLFFHNHVRKVYGEPVLHKIKLYEDGGLLIGMMFAFMFSELLLNTILSAIGYEYERGSINWVGGTLYIVNVIPFATSFGLFGAILKYRMIPENELAEIKHKNSRTFRMKYGQDEIEITLGSQESIDKFGRGDHFEKRALVKTARRSETDNDNGNLSEAYPSNKGNREKGLPAEEFKEEAVIEILNDGDPPVYIDPATISHAFIVLTMNDIQYKTALEEEIANLNRHCQPRIWREVPFETKFGVIAVSESDDGSPDPGLAVTMLQKEVVPSKASLILNVGDITLANGKNLKLIIGFSYLEEKQRIILPYNDACIPK